MGYGYEMSCPNCGEEFSFYLGIGFLFPTVYKETVQKAKKGELGEEIRDFFRNHKDGAIDAESVILCCKECGNLESGKDLTMYVPKDSEKRDEQGFPGSEGSRCLMRQDLKEDYVRYAGYPHKCKKCGGKMKIYRGCKKLSCPKCKTLLKTEGMFMWD